MRACHLKIPVLITLLTSIAGCEPIPDSQARSSYALSSELTVTRMDTRMYEIQTGPLRYIVRARNVGTADGRYQGVGQYRLTSLYWRHEDIDYQLLECGQCDGLEALSLTGVTAAWTGGGHGMESDPMGVQVLGDGIALDLEIGESVGLSEFELQSSTVLFALEPGGNVYVPTYPRHPVSAQTLQYRFTADEYAFRAETLALADHFRHLRYTEMIQGPETSRPDGIFDSWRVYDDRHLIASQSGWDDCSSENATAPAGDSASLVSSRFDMALTVHSDLDLPWYISHRSDSCHIKMYQRDTSLQLIPQGQHATYAHRMRFESPSFP